MLGPNWLEEAFMLGSPHVFNIPQKLNQSGEADGQNTKRRRGDTCFHVRAYSILILSSETKPLYVSHQHWKRVAVTASVYSMCEVHRSALNLPSISPKESVTRPSLSGKRGEGSPNADKVIKVTWFLQLIAIERPLFGKCSGETHTHAPTHIPLTCFKSLAQTHLDFGKVNKAPSYECSL